MKRLSESILAMELPELIQLNQLVRGGINMTGFVSWYDAMTVGEQSALLTYLHVYAQQAGYDQQAWKLAINEAGLTEDALLIQKVASFRGGYSLELSIEQQRWLSRLDSSERRSLLPLLVYLFGYAEGRVFTQETEENCNHWWHRDLLDEQVVQVLFDDPEYWRTSMKDDRAIKRQGRRDEAGRE